MCHYSSLSFRNTCIDLFTLYIPSDELKNQLFAVNRTNWKLCPGKKLNINSSHSPKSIVGKRYFCVWHSYYSSAIKSQYWREKFKSSRAWIGAVCKQAAKFDLHRIVSSEVDVVTWSRFRFSKFVFILRIRQTQLSPRFPAKYTACVFPSSAKKNNQSSET